MAAENAPESVSARDFSNFRLDDNVYELAGGLLPEIADRLQVDIGSEPSSTALDELGRVAGKNKVLRENKEVEGLSLTVAAELLERSGVQKPLNRSLWTPNQRLFTNDETEVDTDPRTAFAPTAIIGTGAVANWQDRFVSIAATLEDVPIYYPVGSRLMNSATEQSNTNVAATNVVFRRPPTELSYASSVIQERMRELGRDMMVLSYGTDKGSEIAERFFADEQNRHLLEGRLAFARVANAGIQLAVQFRKAAQAVDSQFDANPLNPQVFVVTDKFKIATTEEQKADPAHFQSPFTGLRQVVVTAKSLHEAAGGQ